MTKNSITISLTLAQIYLCIDIVNANDELAEEDHSMLVDILDAVIESLYNEAPITVEEINIISEVDNVIDIFTKKARW
ncbi:MAG: hypothetical protein V3U58_03845 [Thermodesulfobacteriota bacterium]